MGYFDYLGGFITCVLLRRYTFNEFLNLINITLTFIFILSEFQTFAPTEKTVCDSCQCETCPLF